jgi:hypothetical protein
MVSRQLHRLVGRAAPALLAAFGVGPETASALLVPPGTTRSGCTDAALRRCVGLTGGGVLGQDGAASAEPRWGPPGQQRLVAHVLVRLRAGHPPTVAYLQRRTAQGKSKREVIRCLKRYIAQRSSRC